MISPPFRASHSARRGLQLFLTILGCVALVAGAATVLFGVDSVVGAEHVSGTVDSEMRLYVVWYAAAGLLLIRSVPRLETEKRIISTTAILFFLAGASRALSWVMVGRPHTLAVVLMIVELSLPFVILPWQAVIARTNAEHRSTLSSSKR